MQEQVNETMDIKEVMRTLPHRYPFLLVDRVLECRPGERLVGIKNVTANESFFQGHFPQQPVMPGVLLLESMAQACGLLAFRTNGKPPGENIFYLVGIDKSKFKRPVEPGDQLRLEADFIRNLRGIWFFTAEARVDGELAASAEIRCTMREVQA
ncbi:3-hydroxyacyl-ACP dehydratase FabZ [Ectothiorhodospiraceae bacterium WFHF3C12]|nr:3-hydroxyacyl-ACP dehydratase FabZ [Ectothiorhodospiraceae bacterium WFHF3C12]